MKLNTTYLWGLAADQSGIIQHTNYRGEKLRGGGLRAWKEVELHHEPASAYASSHPAPMPLKWAHQDDIGWVVALRRNHDRLHAVATSTLEPAELEFLTEKLGEIKMSTSTNNRRNEKLRIVELSLTPAPATVGLPPVRWYRLGVSKGNPPAWVKEELKRADKLEFRQRREMQVHDLDYERNPYSDSERYEREFGLTPSGVEGRHMTINGERVPLEYSTHPGRILSVEGRAVR